MSSLEPGLISPEQLSLFMDYYELTMGKADFDDHNNSLITENYFIRKIPLGEYLLTVGLEQVIHYITNLTFSDEDLEWLKKTKPELSDSYIDYLRGYKFDGDVYAVPEGTPVFPNEPIINVTGKSIDVQFFETYLLNIMNFQTLIATKTSRIVTAANGRRCVDFGPRRAHGRDASLLAARSAYIAGAGATSLVLAGRLFGIPYVGTMAHKFIQDRDSEISAFRAFARAFPENTVLLIDTYDTIEGAKKAVKVAKEMEEQGYKLRGVRLDSGDLSSLSKEVREILDDAGLEYVEIFASGDLDEFRIKELIEHGAQIDAFGVGTRLTTGANYNPLTGVGGVSAIAGVYKHVERCKNGEFVPTYKLSEEEEKTILPGRKQVYRLSDEKGRYVKDVISLWDESIPKDIPGGYVSIAEPLLVPIVKQGEIVYDFPSVEQIKEECAEKLKKLPEKVKQIEEPQEYPVEISQKLSDLLEKLKRITKCELNGSESIDD